MTVQARRMSSSEKRLQIPFLPKAQRQWHKVDKALPNVAPIKQRVTSPPLKPAPRVNPVNKILSKKS
jgi:hypothetical protein